MATVVGALPAWMMRNDAKLPAGPASFVIFSAAAVKSNAQEATASVEVQGKSITTIAQVAGEVAVKVAGVTSRADAARSRSQICRNSVAAGLLLAALVHKTVAAAPIAGPVSVTSIELKRTKEGAGAAAKVPVPDAEEWNVAVLEWMTTAAALDVQMRRHFQDDRAQV
jgi:hypothetical protein